MAETIPICPLCKLPPRIGDPMDVLRIEDGDHPGTPGGLWVMCRDCMRALLPLKAARMGKPVEAMTYGDYF